MEPSVAVAVVAGVVAVVTSTITFISQRRASASRAEAEVGVAVLATEVDKTKIVVDQWAKLYGILETQVKELRAEVRSTRAELVECERSKELLTSEIGTLKFKVAHLEAADGPTIG